MIWTRTQVKEKDRVGLTSPATQLMTPQMAKESQIQAVHQEWKGHLWIMVLPEIMLMASVFSTSLTSPESTLVYHFKHQNSLILTPNSLLSHSQAPLRGGKSEVQRIYAWWKVHELGGV